MKVTEAYMKDLRKVRKKVNTITRSQQQLKKEKETL